MSKRHGRVNAVGEFYETNGSKNGVEGATSGTQGQQLQQNQMEDDDIETRKGASGGNKTEGPLFDLQQIHLF